MIASPRPLSRSALVAAGRNLNTSLDRVFDDMNSLTAGERDLLATYTGPDGAIVIVHPGAAARDIEIVGTAKFFEARMADRGPGAWLSTNEGLRGHLSVADAPARVAAA